MATMAISHHRQSKFERLLSAFLLILSVIYTDRTSALEPDGAHSITVQEEVAKIQKDPNPASRYGAIKQIALHLSNDSRIDQAAVVSLAGLLTDTDDSVRQWAAVALGRIGPRARSAVPALEKALSEVDCARADKNSRFGIRIALKRIGVTPPVADCVATPGYGLRARRPRR